MAYTKKLWWLTFTTSPAQAEIFAAALEEDALSISVLAPPRKSEAHIEALYNEPPNRAALAARLALVAMVHKTKAPKIEIDEMPPQDWLAKVAGDFPPFAIARWTIYSAQYRRAILRPNRALQIDATSAFGTGEHPTTRGCLLMLDELLRRKRRPIMLDLGCGSGILAMALAQATHNKAVAVDNDPESVAVATENVRINGLQSDIRVTLGNGYNSQLVHRNAPYDLIMANIFAGPLCQMANQLKNHLCPGGAAILSGILNHQANRVINTHRMQGLHLIKHLTIGEWSVLALRRPQRAK